MTSPTSTELTGTAWVTTTSPAEKVGFIDSFGVGEILASYISTHNLGGKLKLTRISKKLYLIFQVTMLTKVLDIFENEDAALQSFRD